MYRKRFKKRSFGKGRSRSRGKNRKLNTYRVSRGGIRM